MGGGWSDDPYHQEVETHQPFDWQKEESVHSEQGEGDDSDSDVEESVTYTPNLRWTALEDQTLDNAVA